MTMQVVLGMLWVVATGCIPLEGGDDIDDWEPGPPPPRAVCGDGKIERHETCDDGNLADGDGCPSDCLLDLRVQVHWQLATLAGKPQPCPPGFEVVEVSAREGAFTLPIVKQLACEAGTGELFLQQRPYVPVDYDIQVSIKSASGELYGQSAVDRVIASEPRRNSDHTIPTDAGTIHVGWSVWLGSQPRFCPAPDLPVTTIDVAVYGETGAPTRYSFPCSQNAATTPLLPAGTYRVEVSGVAGTSSAAATIEEVIVPIGGRAAKPAPVDLVF